MSHLDNTVNAVYGGLLLGFAASIRYAVFGKITGCSGYLVSVVKLSPNLFTEDRVIGLLLIGSFLMVGRLTLLYFPEAFDFWGNLPYERLILGSYLIGYGTYLGNGCTSGHGICGVASFRPRSVVACVLFIGSGMFVASIANSKSYFTQFSNNFSYNFQGPIFLAAGVTAILSVLVVSFLITQKSNVNVISRIYTYISEIILASVFAFGLVISNMVKPSATLAFLDVKYPWYPILVLVLVSALLVSIPSFYFINKRQAPIVSCEFSRPEANPFNIDWKLVLGETIFGAGWGLTGICPGPALVNIARGGVSQGLYLLFTVLGIWTAQLQEYLLEKYIKTQSTKSRGEVSVSLDSNSNV